MTINRNSVDFAGDSPHTQAYETHPQSGLPGRRARHALPAGDQIHAEGDAAGRRPPADPLRLRGSPRRRIEEFIFVTGRNKDAIENHFDHAYELEARLEGRRKSDALALTSDWLPEPGSVIYLRQQVPLGLGHAVWCARNAVGDEPFAVILADDLVHAKTPCIGQMIEAHAQVPGANLAAVIDVPREKTASYGILKLENPLPPPGGGWEGGMVGTQRSRSPHPNPPPAGEGKLIKASGLVEKPQPADAPSTTSIIGRYILQPSIFEALGAQQRGAGGEIQLTDAMAGLIGTVDFYGFRFDGVRYDCGEVAGYIEANVALALARPELAGAVREKIAKLLKA